MTIMPISAADTADLTCLDLNTREVVWNARISGTTTRPQSKPAWGLAQNPLIYGDLVIIAPQTARVGVVARDKKTGQVRWESPASGSTTVMRIPM